MGKRERDRQGNSNVVKLATPEMHRHDTEWQRQRVNLYDVLVTSTTAMLVS